MYYSLVIDAFYINKQYEQEGIIGKGKDFVHGISSTIYLVRDKKEQDKEKGQGKEDNGKKHALQIYEGLTDQIYQTKVQQLQLAMTERVTNYTTRIQLIGSKRLNKTTYDLYVLYEFDQLTQNLAQLPPLKDEAEAKKFLAFLCSNLMIQGKYTNEFLDISPYNIYKNNGNKDYGEYVITNFGLNFKGSKFHSYYYPTTDNFFKEKQKSIQSTIYSYSFQAALVTLYYITKIDPRNFFFDDGQFKDRLAMNIISLLKIKPEDEKEDQKKKYEQKLSDVQKQLIPVKQKAGEENPAKKIVLERTYSKEFLSILQALLQLDHSKRSIFPQLIKYNQDEKINPLGLEERYFDEQDNFKQKGQQKIYVGFGKLENKQITPDGVGFGEKEVTLKTKTIKKIDPKTKQPIYGEEKEVKTFQRYCGNYENGQPKGIGCTVLRDGTHLLAYILSEDWIILISDPLELPDALYKPLGNIWFGKYDQNFIPQLKGTLIMIQNPDQNLPKKFTAVCYEGEVVDGQKKHGTEYYQAKNYFIGEFLFNIPSKGVMAYSEDHFFEGTFQDFKRKAGQLFFGLQTFEGTFVNDKISDGTLKYENSAEYNGQFKNGLRDGKGTLTFQNYKLIYEGTFENNKMHGNGKFKFNGNEYEVDFEKGKLQTTELPPELLKEFDRVRFNKPVQEEEEEEIPEVIDDGQDQGHDMNDSEND